jgi:hypothetical protein
MMQQSDVLSGNDPQPTPRPHGRGGRTIPGTAAPLEAAHPPSHTPAQPVHAPGPVPAHVPVQPPADPGQQSAPPAPALQDISSAGGYLAFGAMAGKGPRLWCGATPDAAATATAAGYFDAYANQLMVGDFILFLSSTGTTAVPHILNVAGIAATAPRVTVTTLI